MAGVSADDRQFMEEKQRVLCDKIDLSRKGAIDAPVADLVHCLNTADHYYTTSSCSGRILVYADHEKSEIRKKGCQWLLISHEPVSVSQLTSALADHSLGLGYTFFKFEPFVLHVVCSGLASAQKLLSTAVAAGFRNSGIMVGKKQRFVLAVRSTHTLEAPIAYDRKLLVSEEYLTHLVTLANQKLAINFDRINRFHTNVKNLLAHSEEEPTVPTRRRRTELVQQSESKESVEKVDDDIEYVDVECLFVECNDS